LPNSSRIDNEFKAELAELKRSQAAALDMYKAELKGEVVWKYTRHIDETKAGIEEVRSKIKEIVDYEGHSLQWLINCIRQIAGGIAAPGFNNAGLLNIKTPQPPTHLRASNPAAAAAIKK
jgi:hypothetical protein